MTVGLIAGVASGVRTNDGVPLIGDDPTGNTEEMSPIFASDHPKLYDAGEMAEEFAEEYDGVITSTYAYDNDKTELSFNIYGSQYPRGDKMLHGIEIYPRHNSLDIEQAMDLAQNYLPMEVIKQWYEQKWSKIYYDYDGDSTLYAQLYTLTSEGKNWVEENDNGYNYVLILVKMHDGVAQNIVLRTTNSMPNVGQKPRTEDWDYTIL